MKRYMVEIPIAGIVSVEVDADSEESAIDRALQIPFSVEIDSRGAGLELDEIDVYREICTGNVLHVPLNRAEISSEEDIDD